MAMAAARSGNVDCRITGEADDGDSAREANTRNVPPSLIYDAGICLDQRDGPCVNGALPAEDLPMNVVGETGFPTHFCPSAKCLISRRRAARLSASYTGRSTRRGTARQPDVNFGDERAWVT